jgi:hypothetical protein
MDDLEFSARAHANPEDSELEFLDAISGRSDRQQLLSSIKILDTQLKTLSASIDIPVHLRQKLQRPKQISWLQRSAYALAASLAVAFGFVVSSLPYRPSADEIAMHDSMIEHLIHEEPQYAAAQPIQWSEVEAVLASASISMLAPEGDNAMIITFVKLCGLAGDHQAVHLVAVGERGPVSVLLIHSPPVGGNMVVKDNRYKGRIMPTTAGNMAVVGEKDEDLAHIENIISASVNWLL